MRVSVILSKFYPRPSALIQVVASVGLEVKVEEQLAMNVGEADDFRRSRGSATASGSFYWRASPYTLFQVSVSADLACNSHTRRIQRKISGSFSCVCMYWLGLKNRVLAHAEKLCSSLTKGKLAQAYQSSQWRMKGLLVQITRHGERRRCGASEGISGDLETA